MLGDTKEVIWSRQSKKYRQCTAPHRQKKNNDRNI